MIRHLTDKGEITISDNIFKNIAGAAATNCFGVKGMAVRSMTDGLVHLLRREAMGKGIKIYFLEENTIAIDLHIVVDHGINIPALAASIVKEVRYVVQNQTGATVQSVNVMVDSVTID